MADKIRRLQIAYDLAPDDPNAFIAPDGTAFIIRGDTSGLDQIAEYARHLAAETGDPIAHFEILWPWETEDDQTWDAVRVDTTKIDAADPADWWISTLPPYGELTAAQRLALGIEV